MSTDQQLKTTLGPLKQLIGTWVGGRGINIIAVPNPSNQQSHFKLVENPINESITFQPIGGEVPDQGLEQFLGISGLFYEWRVASAEDNRSLHFENGMILVLEMQEDRPEVPKTVARQISVPHGNTVLSIGNFIDSDGAPPFGNTKEIPPMNAYPIGNPVGDPRTDPAAQAYLEQYRILQTKLANQLVQLDNMNTLLENQINAELDAGFTVGRDLILENMTTKPVQGGGGIHNIDFVKKNANVTEMVSTFWIETLTNKSTGAHKQLLQYNQNITLEFFNNADKTVCEHKVKWPHIVVNTLTKQ